MILIFHLIYSAPSIVVYNYAFFLLFPSYLCKDGAEWKHCSREEMCAQQMLYHNRTMSAEALDDVEGAFESQVDWNDPLSLRNWITRLNLDCSGDALIISLFGSYEFFGQLVACLVFPPLADLFGRKLFTFIGMGLQTFVFIGLIAFKKYQMFYLLIFILGNAVIIRYLIAYAHLMEFVAQKQNLITGVFLFLDGLVYVYSPMFLVYVVKSTQYFVWMALICSLMSIFLLGFIFHMPESLKYSLVKQDFMKFENDKDYICEMNRATEEQRYRIDRLVERYTI